MSEDHGEEIASAESLRQLVEERLQSSEAANAACRLAGLSIRGNAAQKRGRLLQFISGAAARRRPGWLDLILRAAEAGATGPEDLDDSLESDDPGGLPADSADLLLDLLERLPAGGLDAPLPAKLLRDLERQLDDGRVLFSLPDGFTLPSLAQIRSFSGNDDGDEGDFRRAVG